MGSKMLIANSNGFIIELITVKWLIGLKMVHNWANGAQNSSLGSKSLIRLSGVIGLKKMYLESKGIINLIDLM